MDGQDDCNAVYIPFYKWGDILPWSVLYNNLNIILQLEFPMSVW